MAAALAAATIVPPASAQDAGTSLVRAGPSILFPLLDPARGRALFVDKGCVVCHSVNGVGGEIAPVLDAARMPPFANPQTLPRQ